MISQSVSGSGLCTIKAGGKRVNPLRDPATIWLSWPAYQAASCRNSGSDRGWMLELCRRRAAETKHFYLGFGLGLPTDVSPHDRLQSDKIDGKRAMAR